MKAILLVGCLAIGVQAQTVDEGTVSSMPTAGASTPYSVVERGPNHRVWERMTYETGPMGKAVPKVHRYTELATGMHYQQDGQWVETKEKISVLPAGFGAAATNGPHQVYFPPDIYSGVIKMVTTDGQQLHSRPLGISYFDGTNSVMIAELTNSIGQILPSGNQVIYTNAFTDFAADLVCTYRKAGFECDLVFREQPPAPDLFGLNPQTSRLELLTEFFDAPNPAIEVGKPNTQDGLADTTLQFGTMTMGRGKAFLVIAPSQPLQPLVTVGQAVQGTIPSGQSAVPVYKSWETLQGRTFLIEEVSYRRINPQLQTLPASGNAALSANSANSFLSRVSSTRLLPPARLARGGTNEVRLAKGGLNQGPGVVLDYVGLNGSTNDFTFQGDTTYLISGGVNLSGGTTTIEGGTVVKFSTNGWIATDGVACQTGPYRPAVFTAEDDDSVGETMPDSTGDPTGYYGLYWEAGLGFEFHDLRVAYMDTIFSMDDGYALTLTDIQVINSRRFIAAGDSDGAQVGNGLFYNIGILFDAGTDCGFVGNQLTVHECNTLEQVTQNTYDLQGNLIQSQGPDGYTVTYNYNTLGQLTNTTDGVTSVTNWFNNQGLQVAVINAFGQMKSTVYDVLDRATNTVDANGVSIAMTYDNLNRLRTRSYPDSGVESLGYTLNVAGLTSYTNQIGNAVLYGYDPAGRKTNEVAVGVYTNAFTYNGAGDLLSLTDGKNQTTTWNYDQYGRVTDKMDATSAEIFRYAYDADSRLTNRWSAAKGNTTYSYDAVGNLTYVTYPVSPAISLSYDVLNRLTNMVDAVGTTVYGYDAAGQLLSEDGPWANDTVSYTYNNRLRSNLSLSVPNASAWNQTYAYDAAGRLTNVTSMAGAFNYILGGASAASPLTKKLLLPNGAYITNSYDNVARLTSTKLLNSVSSILDAYSYGYNQTGQRTNVVRTLGDYVNYTYDNIGELNTAVGKESGGTTNRLQEQFGYAYDAAGNLNYRTNNALLQTFSVNTLNELNTAIRSGTLTVAGTTTSPATNVTVNTSSAFLYADYSFASPNQSLVDGLNSFMAVARNSQGRQVSNSLSVYLPATVSYQYDANGNMLGDGNRNFAYDDENQLISVWVTNAWRSDFVYDGKMRRRMRKEYSWQNSTWTQTNEVHYVYDGNLVIQERDTNNQPRVTYTRGNDLSGSLQGAGGIGSLLARTDSLLTPLHAYYHADGNGNITALINTNQVLVAKYEYDPYGNILSQRGPLADVNLYRFSSKEIHPKSGLVYYLYRFYDPNTQRWLNRDPFGEPGFEVLRKGLASPLAGDVNRYLIVRNNPNGFIDSDGLGVIAIPIPVGGVGAGAGIGVGGAIGIGLGVGVGAGLFLDTYTPVGSIGIAIANRVCPQKHYKTEACRKIADWVDPATGRRFCRFRCDYSEEIFLREGTGCDKNTIYRVVPE